MYAGLSGGCTTLFHLAVKFPLIVAILGLAGFASQVPEKMGPGDRYGTASYLADIEKKLAADHPELAREYQELRAEFERINPQPSEGMVRQVLAHTDACTDVSGQDVLSDPDERREAAWLYYLNTYAREGPYNIERFFYDRGSPPPLRRE